MAYMTYSFSRLDNYYKCPFKFYEKYVLDKKEEETEPLALGKAVHKAAEEFIKGTPFDEALEIGKSEVTIQIDEEEYRELVRRIPYTGGEASISTSMELEKHFKLTLQNGVDLQGFIDVVYEFEGWHFIDWKTNRRMYNPMKTMQMALYAWALSEMYNVDRLVGTLYFLRFNKPNAMVFTQIEMNKAYQWALNLSSEIENKLFLLDLNPDASVKDLFPIQPSANCSYCSFAIDCLNRFKI